MREHKYKAWDKKYKRWASDKLALISGNDFCYFTQANNDVDLEIVEFTGFVDCNNKEIYESDLLKKVSEFPNPIGKVIIKWGKWEIEYIRGNHPLYIPDVYSNDTYSVDLSHAVCTHYRYEIVGNIFESPDLIKVVK